MKEDKKIIIFISIAYLVGIILGTILGMKIVYDKDKELINNQYIEYYGRLFSIVLNRTANGLDISFKEEVVV